MFSFFPLLIKFEIKREREREVKLTKKKEEREMKTPLISLNKYFNFYKKKNFFSNENDFLDFLERKKRYFSIFLIIYLK